MGWAILVASASPQTYSLFSDLRQDLFWSQVFLVQDAPGGTSLPWSQHSPHLVNHTHALLLATYSWERHPKLPPSLGFQNHSAAALQTNFIFLVGSCINLKPTNNQNQTHPPQMRVGEKQRGVKRMAQLHNPFSPWVHFSWCYSITSWPYLQINNYWKNMAGPHMRIFHSRGGKLCVG